MGVTSGVDFYEGEAKSLNWQQLVIQDHQLIAPYLTITDGQGTQVHRYKAGGIPWNNRTSLGCATCEPFGGASTFVGGSYTIPAGALGGTYTATLELKAGPDLSLTASTVFTVNAKPPAPRIDPPATPTNAASVALTGTALPGARVDGSYTLDGGQPSADVARYAVTRDDTELGTVPAGSVLEFLDSGLTTGTEYRYRVYAVDTAGNRSLPAEATVRSGTGADRVKPAAPAGPGGVEAGRPDPHYRGCGDRRRWGHPLPDSPGSRDRGVRSCV